MRNGRLHRWPVLIVLAGLVWTTTACGPSVREKLEQPGVVAAFRGGVVTVEEVNQATATIPPAQRQAGADGWDGWYRQLIESLAVRKILLSRARAEGLEDDPEFLRRQRIERHRLTVGMALSRQLQKEEPITQEQVRGYYDAHAEDMRVPARRLVSTIFKRYRPGVPHERTVEEVRELRERIEAGEAFEAVARSSSDSETRHRGGLIGWVGQGSMAPELDRILFSLPEGELSEPIPSQDGVHLFVVQTAFEERVVPLAETRQDIRRKLRGDRGQRVLEEVVAEAPEVEPDWIADPRELAVLAANGDSEAEVLRVGEMSLSLEDLQLMVASVSSEDRTEDPGIAQLVSGLRELRNIELAFTALMAEGERVAPEVEKTLSRIAEERLRNMALRREIRREAASRDEQLRAVYENNKARFNTPFELRLRRLEAPLGEQPARTMAEMEDASVRVREEGGDLEMLADLFMGRVTKAEWTSYALLEITDPLAAPIVGKLDVGDWSPPLRLGPERLGVYEVLERRDPQPVPFEQAREQVIQLASELRAQELYRDIAERLLGEAGYVVSEDRIAELVS